MQEAALDPNYESLSWSDSDDYDQYVNEELEDSRSAKWVGLVSRLAGCSLEGKTVLDLGCGPGFFPWRAWCRRCQGVWHRYLR